MSVDLGQVKGGDMAGAISSGLSAAMAAKKKPADPAAKPTPEVKPGPTDFSPDVLSLEPVNNFASLSNFAANDVKP